MKNQIGPAGIAVGVCVLVVVVFILYRVFLPPAATAQPPGETFHRPTVSGPPPRATGGAATTPHP